VCPSFAAGSEAGPGEQVFNTNCAACHLGGDPRALPFETLGTLSRSTIEYALVEGKMAQQGSLLTAQQRKELLDWLAPKETADSHWLDAARCEDPAVSVDGEPRVARWGVDYANTRFQPRTTISKATAPQLRRKWVIAFPGVAMMRSQPAVLGDTLFLAVADDRTLYAIDRIKGCLKWTYTSQHPPRTAVGAGELKDGRQVVYFGDIGGSIHILAARNGAVIWQKRVGHFPRTALTGAPVLYEDTLYVPHSTMEAPSAADPKYECCTSQGLLTAHNAGNGDEIWVAHIMSEPRPTGTSSVGTRQWGPAGGPVWGAPTIDPGRGLIYIGTGNIYAAPDEGTSDAIIALDLKTGARRWVFQATAGDFWNSACRTAIDGQYHPNCPVMGWDFDFGAPPILTADSHGRPLLLAGQKSGELYALNPDSGELVWKKRLSQGSVLGGIHWGMAVDGGEIYVPINDPSLRIPDIQLSAEFATRMKNYQPAPALYKLRIDDGSIVWRYTPEFSCQPDFTSKDPWPQCPREIGLSAAVLAIEGAVISGGLDGTLRIHDGNSGKVLFSDNTAVAFNNASNGIAGHGGSIDNATIVAAGDMLYVQSGYSMFGGTPGNVLIAYQLQKAEK
jgi:polyvinyl alcohol dehydrogenase (cytochrome)